MKRYDTMKRTYTRNRDYEYNGKKRKNHGDKNRFRKLIKENKENKIETM